jgi:hypothetical protein
MVFSISHAQTFLKQYYFFVSHAEGAKDVYNHNYEWIKTKAYAVYIHTNIPSLHTFDQITVGCGKSHNHKKYTTNEKY